MIGEIKEVEIGQVVVYELDDDGKKTDVIKETIPGKKFDIKRQGVSMALEIDSIFRELVAKSDIDMNSDLPDDKVGVDLMIGMRGRIIQDIKRVIISCTAAPKLTSKTFEELERSIVPSLFMKIYYFNIGESKKKEAPQSK